MQEANVTQTRVRPISVAERRKAEELIRQKFSSLEKAIETAVERKTEELEQAWEHKRGVDKLKEELEKVEETARELRKKIEAQTEYRSGDSRRMREVGPLGRAVTALRSRRDHALEQLHDKRALALRQLWFEILSADALSLIDGIPTIEQLKNNGLALLNQPVEKLLR
jgi:hypothetical protein